MQLATVSSQSACKDAVQPLQGFNTHHTITSEPSVFHSQNETARVRVRHTWQVRGQEEVEEVQRDQHQQHDDEANKPVRVLLLLGPPKRGVGNLRSIISLNCPCMKLCILVWDGGLRLMYDNYNRLQTMDDTTCRFTTPPPFLVLPILQELQAGVAAAHLREEPDGGKGAS